MLRIVFAITTFAVLAGVVTLLFILPVPEPEDVSAPSATNGSIAIVNARLFDGTRMIDGVRIIIADGQVARIGADIAIPESAEVIDAAGQTVLPGLIDAHTHTFGPALKDSLRFGVTVNFDMFTDPATLPGHKTARERLDQTDKADLYSAGMLATVPKGHGTQFRIPVETIERPEDARDWVARRLAEGSDYIKIVYMPYQTFFPSLNRATAAALIEAAHEQDVLVVAHIFSQRGALEMIEEGIDGLAHIFADTPATDEFIAQASESGVFVIPTLTVIAAADGKSPGRTLAGDARIEPYLTPQQRAGLAAGFGAQMQGFSLETALLNTKTLYEAGIPIYAGSDAPNPGTTHGASLHQELAYLVEAGLSPAEALRAATSGPAGQFGLTGRGRLAEGSRADLILVDGNPLKDITATRALGTVIKNGFTIERAAEQGPDAAPLSTGLLGTFEEDLSGPDGLRWTATDDQMMEGASSAQIVRVRPGAKGTGGALKVTAEVRSGFAFPWAGAFISSAGGPNTPYDLSRFRTLSFDVRGTPGRYRAMMFNLESAGAPATQVFEITRDWRTVTLDMADFNGFITDAFVGLALVAGPEPGSHEFFIDQVRLEE